MATIKGGSGNIEYRSVRLDCRIFREQGRFIARCDKLKISDHGSTETEAFENLVETLRLFFESCARRGTLLSVFKKREIDYTNHSDRDIQKKQDDDRIIIPIPWMVLTSSDASNNVH